MQHRTDEEGRRLRELQKQLDTIKSFFAPMFDQAMAYTNTVILAGYVAFFTIWGFVQGEMPSSLHLVVALLMSVSCGTFVGFEVYKIIATGLYVRQMTALIEKKPESALRDLAAIQERQMSKARRQHRYWGLVVIVASVSGFSAALLMGGAFVWALLKKLWPLVARSLALLEQAMS